MLLTPSHHAYLTADIPGTGGIIKERPEDFLVEEQPLYQPCGQGEHLFLYLEKRQRTTIDVVRRLAKLFNVRRSDIGYAGMKDKHAVTRQHFSIYKPKPDDDDKALGNIEHTGLKLLWSARHTNKLRRGHHAGNRFVIRIRKVDPLSVRHAAVGLQIMAQRGVPNFIGEQRFGYRQNNHTLGRHLLRGEWKPLLDAMLGNASPDDNEHLRQGHEAYDRGDYVAALEHWPKQLYHERHALDLLRQGWEPQAVVRAMDAQQRDFLINATQSAVFNKVLDRRLSEGTFDHLVNGDLAWKHDNGSIFTVDEATANAENAPEGRVVKLEVSPTGPSWGTGMMRTGSEIDAMECEALASMGLSETDLEGASAGRAVGGRRTLRCVIKDPDIAGGVDEHGPFIRLTFELGRGSYATVALREIIKPELTGAILDDDEDE